MSKPWMPLYVADYRKDTAHLSAAEHGAYLLLIMHYWSTGGLPEDDAPLARIAAMTAAEWRRARPVVQAFFHDGWKHKRIDAELAKAADISSKRAASAKQKHSNSSANAEQLDTHARATSPSQSHSPEERTGEVARKRASRLPSDWKPDEKAKEYARMRGLTAHEIDVQAEKFRNYWLAKSGRSATKFDWDRTWQNWIIDTAEKLGRASLPTGGVAPADLTPAQKEDWAHGWRPGMPTSDELRAKYGGQNGAAAADRLEETSPVDEGGERLRGEEPGLPRGGSRH